METDQLFTYEDGSTIVLEPGKLYQPYLTVIQWITEHRRVQEWSNSGFFGIGGSRGRREWIEQVHHSKEVVKYRKEAIDFDPWTERQNQLLRSEGLRSYRFEKQGADFRTVQGESLTDIIGRCERDEDFRQRTAIWLPVYEQKLT